jgi:hypothetical protein
MRTFSSARADCSGFAVGAILLVVALLAILAIAIAAGSSTFATSSTQEASRTNAAEMISIGQHLKSGVDRVVSGGTVLANIIIDPANTTNTTDLFAPSGGGLVFPSTALANDPASDGWIFTWGAVTNMGTSGLERIAVLKVNQGVCDQINKEGGNGTTPGAEDLGAINNTTNFSAWPSSGMDSKLVGCVNNSATGASGYYFFQVLGVE